MAIKLLRGPASRVNTITPAIGEPLWVTDTFEFRVGDGSTAGGIPLDFVKTDGTIGAGDVAIWTSDNLMGSETKASLLSAYTNTTDMNTALATKLGVNAKAADSVKADDATTLNGQLDTYYLNTSQRSTSVISTSNTTVATSSAVKAAYDNANTRIFQASISQSYTSASTTTVSSSNALKSGVDAVQAQITSNDGDITTLQSDLTALQLTVTNLTNQVIAERISIGEVIEITGDATNPATLKGYGTWVAFGEGRVLVGVGSFTDLRGETIVWGDGGDAGEYRHSMVEAELASHVHTVNSSGAHTHTYTRLDSNITGGGIASGSDSNLVADTTNSTGVHTHTVNGTGSNSPANNMQPTTGVYRWKRTA